MKIRIGFVLGLTLGCSPIWAEKLENGLEFLKPAGWTMRSNGQAAALLPPDMAMEPGGSDPSEVYLIGLDDGNTDIRNAQSVASWIKMIFPGSSGMRLAANAQPFRAAGGSGYVYQFDAVSLGAALRIQVYVVGLSGGGTAGLIAVARPGLLNSRESTLGHVAVSLNRTATSGSRPAAQSKSAPAAAPSNAASGPQAAQWEQRLRGHKLYQFSGYSSGYGSGGYNSQRTLWLGPNGNYEFRRSGSVSVYVDGANGGSSSQSAEAGRWRIYEQSGRVVLELKSLKSGTELIELTSDGSKTLLNGKRWLVGD